MIDKIYNLCDLSIQLFHFAEEYSYAHGLVWKEFHFA